MFSGRPPLLQIGYILHPYPLAVLMLHQSGLMRGTRRLEGDWNEEKSGGGVPPALTCYLKVSRALRQLLYDGWATKLNSPTRRRQSGYERIPRPPHRSAPNSASLPLITVTHMSRDMKVPTLSAVCGQIGWPSQAQAAQTAGPIGPSCQE